MARLRHRKALFSLLDAPQTLRLFFFFFENQLTCKTPSKPYTMRLKLHLHKSEISLNNKYKVKHLFLSLFLGVIRYRNAKNHALIFLPYHPIAKLKFSVQNSRQNFTVKMRLWFFALWKYLAAIEAGENGTMNKNKTPLRMFYFFFWRYSITNPQKSKSGASWLNNTMNPEIPKGALLPLEKSNGCEKHRKGKFLIFFLGVYGDKGRTPYAVSARSETSNRALKNFEGTLLTFSLGKCALLHCYSEMKKPQRGV